MKKNGYEPTPYTGPSVSAAPGSDQAILNSFEEEKQAYADIIEFMQAAGATDAEIFKFKEIYYENKILGPGGVAETIVVSLGAYKAAKNEALAVRGLGYKSWPAA